MGKFTVMPQSTFEELQLDAGVLLRRFDPDNPTAPADGDIICATTGGINASCVPSYSDMGEDVDNCPANTKELKHLDSWESKMSFTSIGTSPESIRLALGAADVSGSKVTPRRSLQQGDFSDLWWVGDRADGGMVAICLKNALSTGGFTLQTTKNGKGQVSVELTGHVSIQEQDTMPMEFYSAAPPAIASVPAQSHEMLGKQVSEFVTPETTVSDRGMVEGTLKYVTGFTAFHEDAPEEQSGNYFPLILSTTGGKMTIKKNGSAAPDKTDMAFDPEILLRVGSKSDTFTIEVDGKTYIRLDFSVATLLSE